MLTFQSSLAEGKVARMLPNITSGANREGFTWATDLPSRWAAEPQRLKGGSGLRCVEASGQLAINRQSGPAPVGGGVP